MFWKLIYGSFINVCIWGVIIMGMVGSCNFVDLMGICFVFGCFEFVIFVGFGFIIFMWYICEE